MIYQSNFTRTVDFITRLTVKDEEIRREASDRHSPAVVAMAKACIASGHR